VRITYEMDGSGEVDMLNVSSFSSNFEREPDETPPSPEMLSQAPTPKIRLETKGDKVERSPKERHLQMSF